MTTRSVMGLLYTAKALINLGYELEPVMQKHGLPIDAIDASARIQRSKELAVLTDIFALIEDPKMGLAVGNTMGLAGYGPLSMLLMTCSTTYEACQIGIKYQTLAYLYGDIRLELGKQHSALIIEPVPIPEPLAEFVLLRDMSGTRRFIQDIHKMNDKQIALTEVCFTLAAPANKRPFEEAFDCPVRFGQDQNRLVLETHYFNAPFPQANRNAFEMYREQCDKMLLEASRSDDSLVSSLQHYLGMFNYEIPSVTEAASTFGMSERTLRRQLKAEGSNYQSVLDQVRYEKAQSWLQNSQVPVEDISNKLGYQEPAAFNHAFKRWSGTTPSQFRKSHSNR